MKSQHLLAELRGFQPSHSSCEKVYCTTCGGIAYAVTSNMTAKLRNEINYSLTEMSVSDFISMGDWGEFLEKTNPIGVRFIFEREENSIDTSNIHQLDRYLLQARGLMRNSLSYKKLLERAVNMAVETSNESLIETVAIILGGEILNYDKLFHLALKKSKLNKNIRRVLYNTLREVVPDVRGYVGDGTTSYAWW